MSKTLHPQYVVGFVDGEGSFHVAIYKDKLMRIGIKVIPEFHVSQWVTSRSVLDRLCDHFGCGYVKANHARSQKDTTYVYVVRNREDLLNNVIPFFQRNELQTERRKDFKFFAQIVQMMGDDKHRDKSGLRKILDLAYQMNQGGAYRKKRHTI